MDVVEEEAGYKRLMRALDPKESSDMVSNWKIELTCEAEDQEDEAVPRSDP